MASFQRDDLKKKLQQGHTVFGTCITSGTPRWAGQVAGANLDFVFLDTEHIALDRAELSTLCNHYKALGITPIVRIPKPDPYRASQVIDDGAIGVIAPYLETVDQIRDLVGATKYRPLKGERLGAILSGEKIASGELKIYLDQYNHGNLCIANIESVPAVERLDDLLTVEGLDAVFIGPHDLSINMGIPEQYDHPDFIDMVKRIIQKSRKYTLGVGIHFSLEPQRQVFWINEGVNIVVHSSDMALFSQRLRADMVLLRKAAGASAGSPGGEHSTI
ncbi:MAG: aldolase/citrate lyase family protein [Cyclobacteriaceae bacterium]|nr:aldolase/citrate lyase family protein [Cyclobacteriaceae bacterium]